MYALIASLLKYALTFVMYFFIYKIVRLIFLDIKTITAGEDAKALLPHLKLVTPLLGRNGEAVSELFPLFHQKTIIGRSPTCHIVLPDLLISSKHIQITRLKTGFSIEDLKSSNGTKVNNVPLINSVELKEGDRIALGSMTLLYSEGGH